MNNSTKKRSSKAIRICALPLAVLVAVSASAATNSWTQAMEEVWKSDTSWTVSLHQEKTEFFNAQQTAAASKEATPFEIKIVTPAGLISVSGTAALTLRNTIPGTQTDESVLKAVLACLETQKSSANTDQHIAANRVIGNSEVNLTIIPVNNFNQNSLPGRIDNDAKENAGRNLTGRLSGTSGTEFIPTSFSSKVARSSLNAGVPVFSSGNFAGNGSSGGRSFVPRTSRKATGTSFAEKLEANTFTVRNSHDDVLIDDNRNASPASENFNVSPSYVSELQSAANGSATGIASSIVRNDLFTAEKPDARNTTDLARIGSPSQSGGNSASLMAPTDYNITTGYQDVPANHFTEATPTFGSLTVVPQSSHPSFYFSATTTVNSASYYNAATPALSNTSTSDTVSVAQFATIPKTPALRRALSIASAPGDKTSVAFSTDGLTLKDNTGAVLSAGTAANGDGMAVQIGYYSTATVGNNFSGTWIPLSGQNSVNSAYLSASIGDEGTLGGIPDGEYYSGDQLEFIEGSATRGNFPSSTTIPLSLRFYNAALVSNATLYNTVSDDLWLWKTPGAPFPIPPQVIMSLADGGLEWQGGAGTEFKTTLAIPEPASGLLFALGAAGLLGRRRRRA